MLYQLDTDTGVQDYYINGMKIALHDSTEDVRIILSNNLNWNDHCHNINITAKTYKILGLLRCCYKTNSIDAKGNFIILSLHHIYNIALKYGGHIKSRIFYYLNVFRDLQLSIF